MLSNPLQKYAAIKHKKTDIFCLEPIDTPTKTRRAAGTESHIFSGEAPSPRTSKSDRMASDIFFQQHGAGHYVPSVSIAEPKRRSLDIFEPQYPVETERPTPIRQASFEQVYASNIFTPEADTARRGSRRHYGPKQGRSDIFHREPEDYRKEETFDLPEQPIKQSGYQSSSFQNLFGHYENTPHDQRQAAQVPERVSGLSSVELSREHRGKGNRRAAPYVSHQF